MEVAQQGETAEALVAGLQSEAAHGIGGNDIDEAEPCEVVVAGEARMVLGVDGRDVGPPRDVLLGRLVVDGDEACRGDVVRGLAGVDHLDLCEALHDVAVERLGPVVAGILHVGEGVSGHEGRQVVVGEVADAVVLAVALLDGVGVVECVEVLAADGDGRLVGGIGKEGDVVCAALQVDDALAVGRTGISVEGGAVACGQDLDVGGVAVGEDEVGLLLAVVAQVAHVRGAGAVAVHVNGVDVHRGLGDVGSLLVVQAEVEGVVLLIEPRADPVEVDELAVLVLVEDEARGEHCALEVGVEGDAGVQAGLVEAQLVVARLEEDVDEVLVVGDVEALEGRVAQGQLLRCYLIGAMVVDVAVAIFEAVLLVGQLSA